MDVFVYNNNGQNFVHTNKGEAVPLRQVPPQLHYNRGIGSLVVVAATSRSSSFQIDVHMMPLLISCCRLQDHSSSHCTVVSYFHSTSSHELCGAPRHSFCTISSTASLVLRLHSSLLASSMGEA